MVCKGKGIPFLVFIGRPEERKSSAVLLSHLLVSRRSLRYDMPDGTERLC